jgi:hypothetical protein
MKYLIIIMTILFSGVLYADENQYLGIEVLESPEMVYQLVDTLFAHHDENFDFLSNLRSDFFEYNVTEGQIGKSALEVLLELNKWFENELIFENDEKMMVWGDGNYLKTYVKVSSNCDCLIMIPKLSSLIKEVVLSDSPFFTLEYFDSHTISLLLDLIFVQKDHISGSLQDLVFVLENEEACSQ